MWLVVGSYAQNNLQRNSHLVGTCEGCEAVFEFGGKKLKATDTLPDFQDRGPRLKVSGTVYKVDGKTPAADVILYVYHTDQKGVYPTKGGETDWARRHGHIRGWIKTSRDGKYTFYTLMPGTYPSREAPAHIHATVLEPDGKYYWLSDYHFSGDPLLTREQTSPEAPRGGSSGLLTLKKVGDLLVGERDIVLGKNVSGY